MSARLFTLVVVIGPKVAMVTYLQSCFCVIIYIELLLVHGAKLVKQIVNFLVCSGVHVNIWHLFSSLSIMHISVSTCIEIEI